MPPSTPTRSPTSLEDARPFPFLDEPSLFEPSSSRMRSSTANGSSTESRSTRGGVSLRFPFPLPRTIFLARRDSELTALSSSRFSFVSEDGRNQKGRPPKLDWNEDILGDEDEDEDGTKKEAAPVKLEKKYGAKTVSTVNFLDDRLIPYDLVSLRSYSSTSCVLKRKLIFSLPSSSFRSFVSSRDSASRIRPIFSSQLPFLSSCPECESSIHLHPSSRALLVADVRFSFFPRLARNEIRRLNDLLQDHAAFGNAGNFVIYPLHSRYV